MRILGSPAKIFRGKVIPSQMTVEHSFIRSKSQAGPVRFIAGYNSTSGYSLELESPTGSKQGSFGPSKTAAPIMNAAYDVVYGKGEKPRHFTTEKSTLFPMGSRCIQTKLKRTLGFSLHENPTTQQLDQRLTAYKANRKKRKFDLACLKGLVPRIASEQSYHDHTPGFVRLTDSIKTSTIDRDYVESMLIESEAPTSTMLTNILNPSK